MENVLNYDEILANTEGEYDRHTMSDILEKEEKSKDEN